MTEKEIQSILRSSKKLTIEEVQSILFELQQDCISESINRYLNEKDETWYIAEINALSLCLELLKKVEEK